MEHGPLSFPGTPNAALEKVFFSEFCLDVSFETCAIPANSSTHSLPRPQLNCKSSNTEVETEEEQDPGSVKVGQEQAEPEQADGDVGEEEGDANKEADRPSCSQVVDNLVSEKLMSCLLTARCTGEWQ